MSDPSTQERIEALLRKSLLGEELINAQFHLFSGRSLPSGRVLKPRVLCANNLLLAKRSTFFLDLLSTDIQPSDSDPSLVDLTDDKDVPSHARIDEYGYGSDSDLDDCTDPVPPSSLKLKPRKKQTPSRSRSRSGDDESSDDGSESGDSDAFARSLEQLNKSGVASVVNQESAVQDTTGDKPPASESDSRNGNQRAIRLRSLGSRHVLVKDTAFQTWYTLLNYLYTDKYMFLPLSSTRPNGQPRGSSTSAVDEPRCSAKSMYRLASKVGLDFLRDEAFSYIHRNLTERNILQELSCSVVSKHPELLEMELDVLYAHIASSTVVAGFPDFARRIANKELPHGADIVIGIHTRLLKDALARARSAALEPDGRERASRRSVTPLNPSDPTATIAGPSEMGSISSGLGSMFKFGPPPKRSDSLFAGAALPASPTPAPVNASSKPLEDVFGSKATPPRMPSSRK